MKEAFVNKKFRHDSLVVMVQASDIIDEYAAQGYSLTLRQLYYQFVARNIFPENRRWRWTDSRWVKDPKGTKNAQPNYNWLGEKLNDARLAGYIDWDNVVDRTRTLEQNSHWDDPADALEAMRQQYRIDLWEIQPMRIEVWIEKEALIGVVADKCEELDVPYFACRGYVSQSAQYRAGLRARSWYNRAGQETVILHFGDHDPSGIDMTRDNDERLTMFAGYRGAPTVKRLALNMDQIEKYDPPSDPAKMTDSRYQSYRDLHGDESWELDALEPSVINELIETAVLEHRDDDLWDEAVDLQERGRAAIEEAIEGLPEIE